MLYLRKFSMHRGAAFLYLAVLAVSLLQAVSLAGPFDPQARVLDFHYSIRGYEPETWFEEPSAVALDDRAGLLYVADSKSGEVDVFSIEGAAKAQYRGKNGPGTPVGIAIDAEGRLYVAEADGPVKMINAKGEVEKLELPFGNEEDVPKPGRMAFDRHGNLYIVDRVGCRLYVFDKERKLKLKLGGKGDKRGQFKSLCDVAVDRQSRIYALDSIGVPVQVFDRKGKYLYRFGFRGGGLEEVAVPAAIFVDRNDQIWIVDKGQHCFKVFDRSGTFLKKLGTYGSEEGAMLQPVDAEMDKFGRIYVAEAGARRVQVFSLTRPFEPFEPEGLGGNMMSP